MRIFRVLCVASLLMLLPSGIEKSHAPPGGDQYYETLSRRFPGLRAAGQFWYRRTGDQREQLSQLPDARHREAYRRAERRVRTLGVPFELPRLRQTRPELVLLLGPGIRYVFAMHYTGPRIILVNTWWTDRMSLAELEMLLVHELAHAVDVQNERRGSRYLDMFSAEDDDDMVADILAMLLFEPGEYRVFLQKYPEGKEER